MAAASQLTTILKSINYRLSSILRIASYRLSTKPNNITYHNKTKLVKRKPCLNEIQAACQQHTQTHTYLQFVRYVFTLTAQTKYQNEFAKFQICCLPLELISLQKRKLDHVKNFSLSQLLKAF